MVVAKNATTTQHGAIQGKTQTHLVEFYNLDMIISVGYRVNSYRGVQFHQWATMVLKEYIKKGFVLNDELTPVEIHFIENFEREQKRLNNVK